jgi:hypothetical protein
MAELNIDPGVKGQTRSTWRDPTHLRGLLMKLVRLYPDASRDELEELFLIEAKTQDSLIDEALRRAFDNDFARMEQPSPRPRKKLTEAEIAAAAERLKAIVLLDLILPNGKKLGDCTGKECRAAGGWLIEVGARVGDRGVVGETLNEAEVAKIFAGDGVTKRQKRGKQGEPQ